jgi:hypothetical protein
MVCKLIVHFICRYKETIGSSTSVYIHPGGHLSTGYSPVAMPPPVGFLCPQCVHVFYLVKSVQNIVKAKSTQRLFIGCGDILLPLLQ